LTDTQQNVVTPLLSVESQRVNKPMSLTPHGTLSRLPPKLSSQRTQIKWLPLKFRQYARNLESRHSKVFCPIRLRSI
jgi:hypothetical protein